MCHCTPIVCRHYLPQFPRPRASDSTKEVFLLSFCYFWGAFALFSANGILIAHRWHHSKRTQLSANNFTWMHNKYCRNEGKRFKQIFELEPLLCSPPPLRLQFSFVILYTFFAFYLFCNCNCIQFWTQCEFVVWLWLREPLMAFYAQLWANLKRLQLLWFQLDKSCAKLSAYYKSPSPYGQSTPQLARMVPSPDSSDEKFFTVCPFGSSFADLFAVVRCHIVCLLDPLAGELLEMQQRQRPDSATIRTFALHLDTRKSPLGAQKDRKREKGAAQKVNSTTSCADAAASAVA